jgi:hypothetical protein
MWLAVALLGQILLTVFFCTVPGVRTALKIGQPIWFHVAFPVVAGAVAWAGEEWRKVVVRQYPVSLVKKFAW